MTVNLELIDTFLPWGLSTVFFYLFHLFMLLSDCSVLRVKTNLKNTLNEGLKIDILNIKYQVIQTLYLEILN